MFSYVQWSYIVLVLYLIVIFIITFVAWKRKVPTPSDYYLGGRTLGSVVLVLTLQASYISMWWILGGPGTFYRLGVWFLCYPLWNIFGSIMIYVIGTRYWLLGKKFGFITPADMLGHYYGSQFLKLIIAVVMIIGLFPYMAIQLSGAGKAIVGLTDGSAPYWSGVLIMAVIAGIYTYYSGLRGVAWTDVFQGLVFMSIMTFTVMVLMGKLGLGTLLRESAAQNPKLLVHPGNWPGWINMFLTWGMAFICFPHVWQRLYMAKSPRVLVNVAMWNLIISGWITVIIAFFFGTTSVGLIPGLSRAQTDMLLPMFFAKFAPIVGIFVLSMAFAAAMSTLDTQLLSCSSIFTRDLYKTFINPKLQEKSEYNLGRLFVFILLLALLFFALTPGGTGLLIPLATIGTGMVALFFPVVLGSLFWSRGTRAGGIAGLLSGFFVYNMVQFVLPKGFIFGHGPTTMGLIVTLVVYYVVSRLTSPVPVERRKEYHDFLKAAMS